MRGRAPVPDARTDFVFSSAAVRDMFGTLVDRVVFRGDHITINRHGKPAVVLVPVEWHRDALAALEAAGTVKS